MVLKIGDCDWCGKPKGGLIEHWTPDGTFHGCSCEDCYHTVAKGLESYFYHGGHYPQKRQDLKKRYATTRHTPKEETK